MKLFFLSLILIIAGCAHSPELPNLGASIKDSELVNSSSYSTYTVFLFARSVDLEKVEVDRVQALRNSFDLFSSGIGPKNIGVWTGYSDNEFDIQKSRDLCDKYNLSYNGGPYMIVSKDNPFLSKTITEDVVVDFDGILPKRIKYVLNEIEKDIRREEYDKSGVYEQRKQYVLSQYDDNKEFIKEVARRIVELIETKAKL